MGSSQILEGSILGWGSEQVYLEQDFQRGML